MSCMVLCRTPEQGEGPTPIAPIVLVPVPVPVPILEKPVWIHQYKRHVSLFDGHKAINAIQYILRPEAEIRSHPCILRPPVSSQFRK